MGFSKFPSVKVESGGTCLVGWPAIKRELSSAIEKRSTGTVVIECYQGVLIEDIIEWINIDFPEAEVIESSAAMKAEADVRSITHPDVTDDRVFGVITQLRLVELFDTSIIGLVRKHLKESKQLMFVVGVGASLLVDKPHLLVYADMARWEIQLRMRKHEIANIGLANNDDSFETQYKRGYFLDWRLCDGLKKELMTRWDYVLDTNDRHTPKMITAAMFNQGMDQAVKQPFSVVPFFDPGPWGGQWMKEKFDLDRSAPNYAWCFNCVPEENSLLLEFNKVRFETPSINLVFARPRQLLGANVQKTFGDEFPIRFDFLDTIGGGNLSLQVHPLTEYVKKEFGMAYTQDESYYILDADDDASVYLGLKENVDGPAMIRDLNIAQSKGNTFDAGKYAQQWPAKKHDHFLIPAGTVHCSARGCMILEISATPYIFTFKLWDWGRVGLDGNPRPINIERGAQVIQWDRQPEWTRNNLINRFEPLAVEEDWKEEQTGLHQLQFIETRRYWHSGTVLHRTDEGVHVLMVIEGEQALVESPTGAFEPFPVNYAEAFVIPANIKEYSIRPAGTSEGKEIGVIKAYVRN